MTREEKVYELASRLRTGADIIEFVENLDDETLNSNLGIYNCEGCGEEFNENDLNAFDECSACEREREEREEREENEHDEWRVNK